MENRNSKGSWDAHDHQAFGTLALDNLIVSMACHVYWFLDKMDNWTRDWHWQLNEGDAWVQEKKWIATFHSTTIGHMFQKVARKVFECKPVLEWIVAKVIVK
jgi:hypothetical protein